MGEQEKIQRKEEEDCGRSTMRRKEDEMEIGGDNEGRRKERK